MADFTFTKLADTIGPYSVFRHASINNQGTVAFEAFLDSTLPPTGIFTTDSSGQTKTIADNSAALFTGQINPSFGTSINDHGTVGYVVSQLSPVDFSVSANSVYTSNSGQTTTIASNSGNTSTLYWSPTINNTGTVAYMATDSSYLVDGQFGPQLGPAQASIFTSSGGVSTTIASSIGDFSYFNVGLNTVGGDAPLASLTVPSINDQGIVAFNAGLDAGGQGIFTGSGGEITTIADTTSDLFKDFNFKAFSSADVNNLGTVAFLAEFDADQDGTANRGIFTSSGGQLTTLVDDSGGFSYFNSDPAINDQGLVAFWAKLDNGVEGIFTGSDPVADKLIAVGDSVFGSTVTKLSITQQGLNNGGQVAFEVELADGTKSVFRADPKVVPEPSDGIVSVLALAILFMLGWRWRNRKQFPKHAGR